jgi:hypothetical protein
MRVKPTVYFEKLDGFYPFPDPENGEFGFVLNVPKHPELGSCPWIRTSTVLTKIRDMDGEVEEFHTLNTIYKRR